MWRAAANHSRVGASSVVHHAASRASTAKAVALRAAEPKLPGLSQRCRHFSGQLHSVSAACPHPPTGFAGLRGFRERQTGAPLSAGQPRQFWMTGLGSSSELSEPSTVVPNLALKEQDALAIELAEFANKAPTPIPLGDILAMTSLEEVARLLQEELPVRIANRVAHLDTLPQLGKISHLSDLREKFAESFREIRRAEGASPDHFLKVMRRFKSRHQEQAQLITLGMRKWKELRLSQGMPLDQTESFVDTFLDRFFLSWIGLETLASQFMALPDSPTGVVNPACDPCDVARRAADRVTEMATRMNLMVVPPKVEVQYYGTDAHRTLPLVPTYLFYILIELIKNSFRAAGEHHEELGGRGDPPTVVIRVSCDASQVVLQIGDRGGGIPFERQARVWSYMYSTANGAEVCQQTGRILKQSERPSALAGYGVGLPLSRLYAEYLGGSLHLMSMPNFGTHAYVYLSRMGDRNEALPTYVNWLRRSQLIARLAELNQKKADAAQSEEYFEAARFKAMAAEAQHELDTLENPDFHAEALRNAANAPKTAFGG